MIKTPTDFLQHDRDDDTFSEFYHGIDGNQKR